MLRFDAGVIAQHQITNDGYLRAYMRIAKADHALKYRNPLGATKTEIITEQELFNKDSLDSFMMLPITNEHPPMKVSAENYRQYGRGATGQTLIREVTPIGTFLGTIATIHDGELVNAIVSGEIPGVSPGYAVKVRNRSDGVDEQFDRRGNHVAAVRNPRGGADVRTVLEGIRADSFDNDEIWVQDEESGIYRADVGDWILPLLSGERSVSGIAERNSIVLDKADSKKAKPMMKPMMVEEMDEPEEEIEEDSESHDSGCDCESCSAKPKGKAKKRSTRKDSIDMDRTTIEVGGIPLEMPTSHAAIIQQELERRDSLRVDAEGDANDRIAALQSETEELRTENEEMRSLLQEFVELNTDSDDEEEEYDDEGEEEDDPLSFDSVEALSEFVADSVDHYLKLEADAKLVGLEFGVENRKDAIEACLVRTEDVQRQILATANPGFKTDSYDDAVLDAVYEVAMQPIRSRATQGSEDDRSDAVDYTTPLKAIGSLTSAQPSSGGGLKRYYEQQDAAFIGAK